MQGAGNDHGTVHWKNVHDDNGEKAASYDAAADAKGIESKTDETASYNATADEDPASFDAAAIAVGYSEEAAVKESPTPTGTSQR